MTETIYGEKLIDAWSAQAGNHQHATGCPICGKDMAKVGIVHLVYTFESCDCGEPKYRHLIETLWHRDCFLRPPAEWRGVPDE